jgi:hypothetical protein
MTSKGWHSRGHLPHFESPETLQFVTFRLFDSLPAKAIEQMQLAAGDADRDAAPAGYGTLRSPGLSKMPCFTSMGHLHPQRAALRGAHRLW